MNINLIIEQGDSDLWGRVEGIENFFPVAVGKTVNEVIGQMKEMFADHAEHEGKEDPAFKKIDLTSITFSVVYDLQSFFSEHDYLNISAVAKRAQINPSLLRAYAKGIKHPSQERARKIENVIHELGQELLSVRL